MDIQKASFAFVSNLSTRQNSLASESSGDTFGAALTAESSSSLSNRPFVGDAKIGFGQIGIEARDGHVHRVFYYDQDGGKLTTSGFDPAAMLTLAEKFSIPREDFAGLGDVLDEAGIAYRPHELYAGTGSDHGIDLHDLASGGLGTAYDWRHDSNVASKGESGLQALQRRIELAEELRLILNPEVTK